MIFLGGMLHLVVVLSPYVLLGGSLEDPAVLAFAVGMSALYFGDTATMRWTPAPSSSPVNVHAYRWAALTGVLLLLVFWSSSVERAWLPRGASWLQIVGAALLAGGVVLRAISVRTLGRSFRTEIEPVDGELVQRGIYRIVRHPSETGLLAASLGAAVLLQSAAGLALWCAALVPVTLVRISREEHALIERFGDSYRGYAEHVRGLLPCCGHFLP